MPVQSRNKWARDHFSTPDDDALKETKVQCNHTKPGGSRCTQMFDIGSNHYANMRQHLRSHSVATPVKSQTRSSNQPVINFPDRELPTFALAEEWAILCVFTGASFRAFDALPDTVRRRLENCICGRRQQIPERHSLSTGVKTAAVKVHLDVLQCLNRCSLAFDSGTIHESYLVVTLLDNSSDLPPYVHTVVAKDTVGGSFTGEVIEAVLRKVADDVAQAGGRAIACVADNAANMQRAAQNIALFPGFHCAAHTFNLIFRDSVDKKKPDLNVESAVNATEIAERLAEEGADLPRIPDTRWCYQRDRWIAAVDHCQDVAEVRTLKIAIDDFEPLAASIRTVERNAATLWDAFVCWERLLYAFNDQDTESRKQLYEHVLARIKFWRCDAVIILAFFAPSYDRSTASEALTVSIKAKLEKYSHQASEEFFTPGNANCFLMTAARPATATSYATYAKFIQTNQVRFTALARLLSDFLGATPTEAAVERNFSQIKKFKTDWRNRLSDESVEATLRVMTGVRLLEDKAATLRPAGQPQRKSTRTEQSAAAVEAGAAPAAARDESNEANHSASPEPRLQPNAVPNDERGAVAEAEHDVEEVLPPELKVIFDHICDVTTAELEERREAPAPAPMQRTTTRAQADMCHICVCDGNPTPCKDHAVKAFVVCFRCKEEGRRRRASLTHSLGIPKYMLDAAKLSIHAEMDNRWTCDDCAAKL